MKALDKMTQTELISEANTLLDKIEGLLIKMFSKKVTNSKVTDNKLHSLRFGYVTKEQKDAHRNKVIAHNFSGHYE